MSQGSRVYVRGTFTRLSLWMRPPESRAISAKLLRWKAPPFVAALVIDTSSVAENGAPGMGVTKILGANGSAPIAHCACAILATKVSDTNPRDVKTAVITKRRFPSMAASRPLRGALRFLASRAGKLRGPLLLEENVRQVGRIFK